jgi:hypothetical protein
MKITKPESLRLWGLLVCLLVALSYSATIGTKAVRADSSCTASQCSFGAQWADYVCNSYHFGTAAYVCPVEGGTSNDDFAFSCYDGYHETDDCSNYLNPS